MTFFWIVFLICGIIGMAAGVSLTMTGIKSSRWPKTEGTIESSGIEIADHHGRDVTCYTPNITYTYSVGGQLYRNRQVSTGEHGSNNIKYAQRVVGKYIPNMSVDVFYNPNDPNNALLEAGFSISSILVLIVSSVFFIAALLGLFGVIGKKWSSAFP